MKSNTDRCSLSKKQSISRTDSGVYGQFVIFCLIGCVNTGITVGLFYLLNEIAGMAYLLSSTIAYSAGIVNSYFMNERWTFRCGSRTLTQMVKFAVVNLLGLSLNAIAMYVFVSLCRMWPLFAQILTIGIVMVLNFVGQKLYVFVGGAEPR
jgi:putative flippase GtrA